MDILESQFVTEFRDACAGENLELVKDLYDKAKHDKKINCLIDNHSLIMNLHLRNINNKKIIQFLILNDIVKLFSDIEHNETEWIFALKSNSLQVLDYLINKGSPYLEVIACDLELSYAIKNGIVLQRISKQFLSKLVNYFHLNIDFLIREYVPSLIDANNFEAFECIVEYIDEKQDREECYDLLVRDILVYMNFGRMKYYHFIKVMKIIIPKLTTLSIGNMRKIVEYENIELFKLFLEGLNKDGKFINDKTGIETFKLCIKEKKLDFIEILLKQGIEINKDIEDYIIEHDSKKVYDFIHKYKNINNLNISKDYSNKRTNQVKDNLYLLDEEII